MTTGLVLRDPAWLLLLLVFPLALWLRGRRSVPVLLVPFAAAWYGRDRLPAGRIALALALGGILLLTLALARPQRVQELVEVHREGYDIMLAVDISASMRAEDYRRGEERVNRLDALRPLIQAFIRQRPGDRIGIVLFAGKAYTLSALTFDHGWLERQVAQLRTAAIGEGTAVGDGLAMAVSRLGQSTRIIAGKRPGAFVVLMSDGASNSGSFLPAEAADLARARGIPVYAIAIGREGEMEIPYRDAAGDLQYYKAESDLDEMMLWKISHRTGGEFFRGRNPHTIYDAFAAIDRTQKIVFQRQSRMLAAELFPWTAVPGALLLLGGAVLLRPWRRPAVA